MRRLRAPYDLYLDQDGVEHRRMTVKSPKIYGFVECFNAWLGMV
ncbi:MAG: hypothetical protein AAGI50_15720 [Pseudomonadota bacterium]